MYAQIQVRVQVIPTWGSPHCLYSLQSIASPHQKLHKLMWVSIGSTYRARQMVRPCSARRLKRKNGDRENCGEGDARKREVKVSSIREEDRETEAALRELQATSQPSDGNAKAGVIFVLQMANVKIEILNADYHAEFPLSNDNNLHNQKPESVHQALLAILDSPLNRLGSLRAVYVKIEDGYLFEVKPHVRLPRTFEQFCGIMLELLQRKSVRDRITHEKLLFVIDDPVTSHLPINCCLIGISSSSEKLVHIWEYVVATSGNVNLAFVVGAMPHKALGEKYAYDFMSGYPLGAAYCIEQICNALEHKWKIF